MRKFLLSTVAVGLLGFAAQAEAAIITSTSGLSLLSLGTGNGQGLQSQTPITTASGSVISFSGSTTGVYSGTSATTNRVNGYTSPFGPGSNQDYFAIEPGGSISITFTAARTTFALLWGTIDSYNSITFGTGSTAQTFTGTDVGTATGIGVNGGNTAQVMFSALNSFNTITLTDTQFSAFEFVPAAAVPEPVSLALLGTGLFGLGVARFRKLRNS